jgi:hypothetical protein
MEKFTELLKAMQEKMDIKANQGKIMAKLDAHHKRMMAKMDSLLEKMEACLGRGGGGKSRSRINRCALRKRPR